METKIRTLVCIAITTLGFGMIPALSAADSAPVPEPEDCDGIAMLDHIPGVPGSPYVDSGVITDDSRSAEHGKFVRLRSYTSDNGFYYWVDATFVYGDCVDEGVPLESALLCDAGRLAQNVVGTYMQAPCRT